MSEESKKKEIIKELDERYVKKKTKVEELEEKVKELEEKLAKKDGENGRLSVCRNGGNQFLFDCVRARDSFRARSENACGRYPEILVRLFFAAAQRPR